MAPACLPACWSAHHWLCCWCWWCLCCQFSEWFPDVDRGTLEAHLPYAMLHNAHMELALERQQQASGSSNNNNRGGGASSSDEPVGLGGGRAQVVKPLAFLEEENALAAAASN